MGKNKIAKSIEKIAQRIYNKNAEVVKGGSENKGIVNTENKKCRKDKEKKKNGN
ncbi:MAG: hypothetical protein HFH49_13085 [Lachnospiraceae bacterium]|nr:hypothetical protein [Lachnospiraceae bacterium]